MKWIKASERLPQKRDIYFVKVIHKNDDPRNEDCILKDTWVMESGELVSNAHTQVDADWYILLEWLDESPSPVEGGKQVYMPVLCSERLPEKFVDVPVLTKKGFTRFACIASDGKWDEHFIREGDKIVSWLELTTLPLPNAVSKEGGIDMLSECVAAIKGLLPQNVAVDIPEQLAAYNAYHKAKQFIAGASSTASIDKQEGDANNTNN